MNRRLNDQFQLRLPDGMRERIKLAADLNNRSMNAEIVATLEEHYPPANTIDDLVWIAKRVAIEFNSTDDIRDAAQLSEILKEIVAYLEERKKVK